MTYRLYDDIDIASADIAVFYSTPHQNHFDL